MLVNQPAILSGAFAAEGDKNVIPANNDGLSGLASIAKGFPPITQVPLAQGGQPPQRQDFNGIFNLFSQFLLYAQNGGVYAYNNTLDYQPPCIISHEGVFYSCIAENGPSTSAGVQPVTNSTYWAKLVPDIAIMKGASTSAAGASGLVPTPAQNQQKNFLTGAGVWQAIATTEQAQAGTDDSAPMTALKVKQLIDKLLGASNGIAGLDAAAKLQSILYDFATELEAQAGTNTTKPINAAGVAAAISALAGGAVIVDELLAKNGYVKFSNGLILQWGSYPLGNNNIIIGYTTWAMAISQDAANSGGGETLGLSMPTLSSIRLTRNPTSTSSTYPVFIVGIQQWGYSAFIYGGKKVTFPIPYAVQCYGVVSQNIQTTTDFIVCAINDVDITGFWDSNGSALGIYWFAYGKQQWGTEPGVGTYEYPIPYTSLCYGVITNRQVRKSNNATTAVDIKLTEFTCSKTDGMGDYTFNWFSAGV